MFGKKPYPHKSYADKEYNKMYCRLTQAEKCSIYLTGHNPIFPKPPTKIQAMRFAYIVTQNERSIRYFDNLVSKED